MGIVASHSTEGRRQQEQTRLDSLKTAAEAQQMGAVRNAARACRSALPAMRASMHGEEACPLPRPGRSALALFTRQLRGVSRQRHIEAATGIELDPLFAETAEELLGQGRAHIVQGISRSRSPRRSASISCSPIRPMCAIIICQDAEKDRLKAQLARSLHMEISGLAGLYCYFLLLCHDWMEEQGLAIWLIPSEFMDVNYGVDLAPLSHRAGDAAAYSPLLPHGRAVHRRAGILRRRGVPQITASGRTSRPIFVCRSD